MKAIKISSCYLLLILTIVTLSANAQQTKPLQIGDKLPDLVISGIINQTSDQIHLKDLYKDGLLIIDFWSTYCVPCIYEMKFLDSLKGKYPDKFKVLMVTTEDKAVVHKFMARSNNKDLSISNLLLATGDTILNKYFTHRSVPHNIWIGKDGMVRAITQGNQVTKDHILNFDHPKVLSDLKVKKDNMNFNVLNDFHLGDSTFTYRSIITPYIDGLGGGGTYESFAGETTKCFYYNTTILHLYWAAYSHFNQQLRENLVEVHTTDSLQFFFPSGSRKSLLLKSKYKNGDEWKKENIYCYALNLPKPVPDTAFRDYMFNDLNRQFPHLEVKIETRNIPCTIVTKIKRNTLIKSSKNEDISSKVFVDHQSLRIRDAKIKDVLDFVFRTFGSKLITDPYVVEIDPKQDILFDADLALPIDETNPGIHPDMIICQLNKLGFQFKKGVRPYPILVINDLRK